MQPFGFFNINKPLGMTSHTVVSKIRRGLKIKKVGHAGTLDPLATGVLIVCAGHATRLSEYAMSSTKRYTAQVKLGETTETYDAEGEITARQDASHITAEQIETVLPQFIGQIAQLPPLYSAIKKDGRKLYEVARAGETVEREPRQVTIDAITITDWSPPVCTLDVICGSGTYIRSLAYDIGEALGTGAHLAGLVRTQSGAFRLDATIELDALLEADAPLAHLLPPDTALRWMPAVHLDTAQYDDVKHGRAIPGAVDRPDQTLARAYTPNDAFTALLRADGGLWRPHKVFLP